MSEMLKVECQKILGFLKGIQILCLSLPLLFSCLRLKLSTYVNINNTTKKYYFWKKRKEQVLSLTDTEVDTLSPPTVIPGTVLTALPIHRM
jgi:hypothetical protein